MISSHPYAQSKHRNKFEGWKDKIWKNLGATKTGKQAKRTVWYLAQKVEQNSKIAKLHVNATIGGEHKIKNLFRLIVAQNSLRTTLPAHQLTSLQSPLAFRLPMFFWNFSVLLQLLNISLSFSKKHLRRLQSTEKDGFRKSGYLVIIVIFYPVNVAHQSSQYYLLDVSGWNKQPSALMSDIDKLFLACIHKIIGEQRFRQDTLATVSRKKVFS